MSIWGTTHHLRRLENMESVEGMRVRARKVAKGSSVNSELWRDKHNAVHIHTSPYIMNSKFQQELK